MYKLFNNSYFSSLKDFIELLRPDFKEAKKYVFSTTVFTLAYVATTIMGPYFLGRAIDTVLPNKDISTFLFLATLMTINYVIGYYVYNIQIELHYKYATCVFKSFRARLFSTIMQKNYLFYKEHSPSDLLTHYSYDVFVLKEYFRRSFISFFVNSLSVFTVLVFLFMWNWELALLSLAAIPASIYFIALNNKDLENKSRIANNELIQLNDSLLESSSGVQDIHHSRVTNPTIHKFNAVMRRYMTKRAEANMNSALSSGSISSMGLYMTLLPVIVGGILICLDYPGITIGELVSYHTYLQQCSFQMQQIFCSITEYSHVHPFIERLKLIFDQEEIKLLESEKKDSKFDPNLKNFDLEFQNITYHYSDLPYTLKNFNLKIPYGKNVCISGPSGIGKSTIFNLIMKHLKPDSGMIKLGEVNVENIPYAYYYSYFGYVSMESHFFKTSVYENVTMNDTSISYSEVEKVLKDLYLDKLIESLPKKYNTIIDQKKMCLSQGQIQRILLARALIRKPKILLLDNFSSSIDKDVEENIYKVLFTNFKNQTIVAISHDKRIMSKFDEIVMLQSTTYEESSKNIEDDRIIYTGMVNEYK